MEPSAAIGADAMEKNANVGKINHRASLEALSKKRVILVSFQGFISSYVGTKLTTRLCDCSFLQQKMRNSTFLMISTYNGTDTGNIVAVDQQHHQQIFLSRSSRHSSPDNEALRNNWTFP